MKIILIILFVLVPSLVQAQSQKVIDWTIAIYGVAAFVDVSTTQYGLGKGIVTEANPPQKYFTDKGPVWSGIAKGSMHTGIIYMMLKYRKSEHKRLVFASIALLTAAQIAVDVSNAKVIGER